MPLAGVWEILQVKLQQALHFRPLQNLSTGYPSPDDATSSPRLSAFVVRIGTGAGESSEMHEDETFMPLRVLMALTDLSIQTLILSRNSFLSAKWRVIFDEKLRFSNFIEILESRSVLFA